MTESATAPPGSSPSSSPSSPAPRDRGGFVMTMIGIAALLFLATATLLYLRWSTTIEPSCVVIVNASPALRGGEITVDSNLLPQAHKVKIGDNDRYSIAFYVEPGIYSVKVVLNDETQFETTLPQLRKGEGRIVDLTHIRTTTAPSLPATRTP